MAETSTKEKGAESQETQPRTTISGTEAEDSRKHPVSTFFWRADNHYVHESSSSATGGLAVRQGGIWGGDTSSSLRLRCVPRVPDRLCTSVCIRGVHMPFTGL